jgi:predicted RNA-binding protein YlqC (UPF0109 family)
MEPSPPPASSDDVADDEFIGDAELTDDELEAEPGNAIDEPRAAPAAGAPTEELADLVQYIVSKLVADPESIEISTEHRGGTVYVGLRVPESDLGRVIGREGRTAKAIRTLVSIAGTRHNVHARLDIDG